MLFRVILMQESLSLSLSMSIEQTIEGRVVKKRVVKRDKTIEKRPYFI